MDEYIDFTVTANALAEAAGRAVGGLINKCIKNNNFRYDTYTKLYNSCVVPVMDYSAGVWGYSNYNKPNTVHNRAIRSFLGVHKYTSNIAINGDVGWTPPAVRRKIEMLKLFNRLMHLDKDRLTYRIFKWDWSHKNKTWGWSIRRILKDANLDIHIDLNMPYDNFDSVIQEVHEQLMLKEVDKWKKDLLSQSKLRFYRTFKTEFETEKYVKSCYSKSNRSFIAQIRSGVLPLKVEVGRFTHIPAEQRICDICKASVEDELHFIFQCPVYENLRTDLFNHVSQLYDITNMEETEMLRIFMCEDKVVNKFANFIRNCFLKRNSLLYNSVS